MQKIPFNKKIYRHLLPLIPHAIEQFNINQYDLVISSSHCVAKGIIPPEKAKHICYIHTPMRYIWDQFNAYFGDKNIIIRTIISYFFRKLRVWDVKSSNRVKTFICNSKFIAERVKRIYKRESIVIHPPVNVKYFFNDNLKKENYFLIASAFAPYKKLDIAIKAFNKLKPAFLPSYNKLRRFRK